MAPARTTRSSKAKAGALPYKADPSSPVPPSRDPTPPERSPTPPEPAPSQPRRIPLSQPKAFNETIHLQVVQTLVELVVTFLLPQPRRLGHEKASTTWPLPNGGDTLPNPRRDDFVMVVCDATIPTTWLNDCGALSGAGVDFWRVRAVANRHHLLNTGTIAKDAGTAFCGLDNTVTTTTATERWCSMRTSTASTTWGHGGSSVGRLVWSFVLTTIRQLRFQLPPRMTTSRTSTPLEATSRLYLRLRIKSLPETHDDEDPPCCPMTALNESSSMAGDFLGLSSAHIITSDIGLVFLSLTGDRHPKPKGITATCYAGTRVSPDTTTQNKMLSLLRPPPRPNSFSSSSGSSPRPTTAASRVNVLRGVFDDLKYYLLPQPLPEPRRLYKQRWVHVSASDAGVQPCDNLKNSKYHALPPKHPPNTKVAICGFGILPAPPTQARHSQNS
ncbi:hypothetical protein BDN72DRAFT_865202 [Pluteus cervinus]|uniref:Uncharacterized protein n=1 Tax=Pluteus cervinus TaxID=181527 RepID=A0ACD3A243_9AGAR|nr:hypothetical protein BDN72DRAFT_865202 [Pluteus cervinus]